MRRDLFEMNRLQFLGQAHSRQPISLDNIVTYFDHTMAAYDVLGNICSSIQYTETDEFGYSMKIKATCLNISEMDSVVDYVNNILNNRKKIYDREFNINANVENSCIELDVRLIK